MKKIILFIAILFINSLLFGDNDKSISSVFLYIPVENEIQYYMNFYERLKKIEKNEMSHKEISSYYDTFLKQEKYRNTYQSLLLESYLMFTQNDNVKKTILSHITTNKYADEFSETLKRLYSSKKETIIQDKNEQIRFNFKDKYFDEYINLFNMSECTFFNDELGIMKFDNNNWAKIIINDKETSRNTVSFLCGGGTNSILMTLDKYNIPDYDKFSKEVIQSPFYKNKYKNYQLSELPNQGVLSRAGAEKISIGIGHGKDQLPDIESFTVVLYMYSTNKKCGYAVKYYINISKINNNYKFRNRMYNHLLFQILLSWINV